MKYKQVDNCSNVNVTVVINYIIEKAMFHAVVDGGCLCHFIIATSHQILSRTVENREAKSKGNYYIQRSLSSL